MLNKIYTLIIFASLISQSLFATCNLTTAFNYKTNNLVVNFTNRTTGDIKQLVWNFGDGSTSQDVNPTHTYNNAGTYEFSLTATSTEGCVASISGKVYVFENNQSTENTIINQINAYPNPFTETSQFSFTSQNTETATITLNDTNGKVVATIANNETLKNGTNTFTIYRNNLPSGMYFVNITTQNKSFVHKIQIM